MFLIVAVLALIFFGLSDDVLRHHNARVHQHSYGDGDPTQRHYVRRNACNVHEEERPEYRKRQRNCNYEDAAEVPEKENVRQSHEDDLLDQRMA